ncbi:MAG: MBL fold metallo-hydrolase [Candidatus Aenigmatarchaeota archaeon]
MPERGATGKAVSIAIAVVLVISLISLGISILGYTRAPEKDIRVLEASNITRQPEGPVNTGTSNGYIITFENGAKFYFAGDTALFGDMRWVVGDYYNPDVAFVPIGNDYTMDPVDAAYATTWINPRYVIPYHYQTFQFLTQDPAVFVNEVTRHRQNNQTRAEVVLLEYGEETLLDGVKVWWLGHGTFLFESPTGTRILLDPWLKPNPNTPAQFRNLSVFGDIDIILITHGHLDHATLDELKELERLYNPVMIVQWELGIYLQNQGITGPVVLVNKGGKITKEVLGLHGIDADMPDAMKIMLVSADHSSSPP